MSAHLYGGAYQSGVSDESEASGLRRNNTTTATGSRLSRLERVRLAGGGSESTSPASSSPSPTDVPLYEALAEAALQRHASMPSSRTNRNAPDQQRATHSSFHSPVHDRLKSRTPERNGAHTNVSD